MNLGKNESGEQGVCKQRLIGGRVTSGKGIAEN